MTLCIAVTGLMLPNPCFFHGVVDAAHCNARVIVRLADSREPVDHVRVSVRANPRSQVPPVGSEQYASTDIFGVAEFAALPVAVYQVALTGIARRRPARNWRPPPGPRPNEVAVGFDPYRRPDEVQAFALCREWRVRTGDCTDSLVVLVRPTKWRRQSMERVIHTKSRGPCD